MGYFPFFVELSGREGLIVGGGSVALRKIEKLLPYGAHLTVLAPGFLEAIEAIDGLTLLRRPFGADALRGKAFVIAATDDNTLNHQIAALCQQQRILVNVVDDREACTFLFPALVKRGDLSIGISTGGASPSAAIHWKEQIAAMLPENTEAILDYLDNMRTELKEQIPDAKLRMAALSELFAACMAYGRALNPEEENAVLAREKGGAI